MTDERVRQVLVKALALYPELVANPPSHILGDFTSFLLYNPDETNFRIVVDAHRQLWVSAVARRVKCLEKHCRGKEFALDSSPFLGEEGSRVRGMGTIASESYVEHIKHDKMHMIGRDARLCTEAQARGTIAGNVSQPARSFAKDDSNRSAQPRLRTTINKILDETLQPAHQARPAKRPALENAQGRPEMFRANKFITVDDSVPRAPPRDNQGSILLGPIAHSRVMLISSPTASDAETESERDEGPSSPLDLGFGADAAEIAPFASLPEYGEFFKDIADNDDFVGNATVDNAVAQLGLQSQTSRIPGMRVSLLPHQLIGVSWMVKQEKKTKTYGGILADEMGLGKTIQAQATMLLHQSDDPREKSTLIVAPLALIEQWAEEIKDKVKNIWSVPKYHGPGRDEICRGKDLEKYDVVITTYQTLAMDYPDEEAGVRKIKREQKKKGRPIDDETIGDLLALRPRGPLLQRSWWRVILDEVQFIRNRGTKSSRTTAELDAVLRWSLTGTPVTNGLADLYPLFRFSQIRPWYSWKEYNESVVKLERRDPSLAEGLNLVRANRVISLDFAWSQAIEQQAFDRVHRIGQTKVVEIDRLTISNTVEERMRTLQARKQDLADASLGEKAGQKLGKLTIADIAGLFGLDARGRRIRN
ncbi:BQ2448_579 [Microbotryum intermedium]|uniref:BQ2448_579 protein n=1 Tax=Microbotryum intermedium TaxID=269621 RepID=A0A238FBE1_9BASI|nr:BQ2448_579 [Microbotryum intermedium]